MSRRRSQSLACVLGHTSDINDSASGGTGALPRAARHRLKYATPFSKRATLACGAPMFWQRHHPIFRHFILTANAVLPVICILLWSQHHWSGLWAALGVTVLCHAAMLVAIFQPRCPWFGPVIRSFRT